jgi:hypothetical protein
MDPVTVNILIVVGFFVFIMYLGRGIYSDIGDE